MSLWLALTSILIPAPKQQASDDPPEWLIRNTLRWLPLVYRWHTEFPELDPAWVMGVIAQESQGFPYAEGPKGSIGLMQIQVTSWTGTRDELLNPAFNIYVGMRMLTATIEKAGKLRYALGAYNCGFKSLDAGRCYSYGGYAYADKILEDWIPLFRSELAVRAGEDDAVGKWLASLGYDWGLGRWHAREEVIRRRFLRLRWGHPIRIR